MLIVETKKQKLVEQVLRNRYWILITRFLQHSYRDFFRTRCLTFAVFGLGLFLLVMIPAGHLGVTAQSNTFHRVTVRHYDTKQSLSTNAPTVGALFRQLQITLHPTDFIQPALNTQITTDNFQITIDRGRYVKIVDRGQQRLQTTIHTEPRQIVQALDYQLHDEDLALWQSGESNVAAVDVIQIVRAKTYTFQIDNQTQLIRSQADTVATILTEAGYPTTNIAFINPALDAQLAPGDRTVLHYRQPNQRLAVTTNMVFDRDHIDRVQSTYLVTEDETTQTVLNRQLLADEVIGQVPLNEVLPSQLTAQQEIWLQQAGIPRSDWANVNYIVQRESTWRPFVWNTSNSGAYGLCQALPARKMASAGADYLTNPVTQLRWCHQYAQDRYGGWAQARRAWQQQRWW